ncbi:MAG: hypothetical protein KA712_12085 [Myxococcales bacterium]|nr:hypothetical protein [Myxococcales bacterium]
MAEADKEHRSRSARHPAGKTSWPGGAVGREPRGQAEQAADAAEGNKRIPARRAAVANAPGTPAEEGDDTPEAVELSPDEARRIQELKQEAAAEEHRARQAERGHGLHGKL